MKESLEMIRKLGKPVIWWTQEPYIVEKDDGKLDLPSKCDLKDNVEEAVTSLGIVYNGSHNSKTWPWSITQRKYGKWSYGEGGQDPAVRQRTRQHRYTNIKYDKERWVTNGLLCKCKICTQHCHLNTINCRRVESVENLWALLQCFPRV